MRPSATAVKRRSAGGGRDLPREASLALPNGVRLLALPSGGALSCCLVLGRGGVLFEPGTESGTCSLMARSLPLSLAPTRQRGREAFEAAALSRFDAFCDPNFFGVSLTAPGEHLAGGLTALAAMVLEPRFAAPAFEALRQRTVEELSSGAETWDETAFRQLRQLLFPRHPYQRDESGTPEGIAGLTIADVEKSHRLHCVGGNLAVILAGGAATEALLEELAGLFEAAPRRPAPAIAAGAEPRAGGGRATRIASLRRPGRTWIATGYSGIAWEAAGWCALEVAKALLVGVRGNAATGRLVERLRRRGLGYGLECVSEPGFGDGYFAIAAEVPGGSQDDVRRLIEEEIEALRAGAVSAREVRLARKRTLLDRLLASEDACSSAYFAGRQLFFSGDIHDWSRLPSRLEALAGADVSSVAARCLTDAARATVVQMA